jgi:nicotinamidase-related amidase
MSSTQGMVSIGSARANHWCITDDHVDTTRPPIEPRPLSVAARPKRVIIDLARSAFVAIDMQNDFCAEGGWVDQRGIDIAPTRAPIGRLNALLPALRGANVPIVWVNWGNRPDRLNLSPSLLYGFNPTGQGVGIGDPLPGSGAPVLQKDSWAAAVVDELEVDPRDILVDKYRVSGFWDTPLDSILRNMQITTLLFGGVNLDQCVMCTLKDAQFLGYDCLLVEDCAGTTSPDFCSAATFYNVETGGFITDSKAVMSGLADIQMNEDREP